MKNITSLAEMIIKFEPDRKALNTSIYRQPFTQWSNCGERGCTAFPFRFWRGNAVTLAYTMTATYNTSNRKMCIKCMI